MWKYGKVNQLWKCPVTLFYFYVLEWCRVCENVSLLCDSSKNKWDKWVEQEFQWRTKHPKWIHPKEKCPLYVTACSCRMSGCDGINRFYRCSLDSSILLLWPCYWLAHPHVITFLLFLATLWAKAHPASHQRVLPNTQRTTFINVTGLLPAVHFFLWVPHVHFSCSSNNARYLAWPVPPQQNIHSISFKVLLS